MQYTWKRFPAVYLERFPSAYFFTNKKKKRVERPLKLCAAFWMATFSTEKKKKENIDIKTYGVLIREMLDLQHNRSQDKLDMCSLAKGRVITVVHKHVKGWR